MKKLLLACCLLFSGVSFAQVPEWSRNPDTLLAEAVDLLMGGQFTEGDSLLNEILEIAMARKDSTVAVRAISGLVNLNMHDANYMDSLLKIAAPMVRQMKNPVRYMSYFVDMAAMYGEQDNYPMQILYVDSALQIAIHLNDSLQMGMAFLEMAGAQDNVKNYPAGIDASRKAIEIFKKLDNNYYLAYGYGDLADCFLWIGEIDSGYVYFMIATQMMAEDGQILQALSFESMAGKCLMELDRYDEAIQIFERVIPQLETPQMKDYSILQHAQAQLFLAEAYLATGKPEKAEPLARKGWKEVSSMGRPADNVGFLDVVLRASLARDPELLDLFGQFVAGSEALYQENNTQKVLEFQAKFEARERENKILELDNIAQLAEIRAERTRFWLLSILSVIVVVALIIAVIIYRSRIRSRARIEELNQKALQLQINPHFFFNALNSINQYITENDAKAARYYLAKFARLMRLTLENSRNNAVMLGDEVDLVLAYLTLEKMRNPNFEVLDEVPEELRDVKVPPMLLQPFAENAVLHAFPEHFEGKGTIWISATKEGNILELVLSDNGVGFKGEISTAETGQKKTSLAMVILRERLVSMNAKQGGLVIEKLHPENKDFPGTRIIMRIPLNSRL